MYFVEQEYFQEYASILKNYFIMNFRKRQSYNDLFDGTSNSTDSKAILDNSNLKKFNELDDPLPIVVLIGGYAGSGKTTFIDYCGHYLDLVYEKSSIDTCKAVVKYMEEIETFYPDCGKISENIDKKSDKYRTLLSKLKALWCEFDDGPNEILLHSLDYLYKSGENVSLVFINVREPEQIDHLKKRLEAELNCIVITLCVLRNDVDEVSNDSDNSTLDYFYDTTIFNNSSLDYLDLLAKEFCCSIVDTNEEARRLKLKFQESGL